MAYSKYSRYSKPRNRRRMRGRRNPKPWYSRSYTPYQIAMNALAGVKSLRRLVNVEKKKFDAVYSASSIPNTGTLNPLHAIAQGDTDSTRNGNSIKPLYLNLSYQAYNNATAGTTSIRILIVRDIQQISDTSPSVTDVLDGTVAQLCNAPLNNETVGRFKVLRDFNVVMDSARANRKDGWIRMPLYGHIRYNGAASTDIQKGGLYIVMVSDQGTNYPTMSYNFRLTYVDN